MPRTGRRPGRPDTRAQIVTAAARCFASAGPDATRMRQVAAGAGVDRALVRRFFGKEELFTEVASALIDPDSALTVVADGPVDQAGECLLQYFLALLGDVRWPGPLLGLVRSAVTSEHAADVRRRFLAGSALGGIAARLHADHRELRAALVASQPVGIAVAWYAVRLAPLAAAATDGLAGRPVLQYYLTGEHITQEQP